MPGPRQFGRIVWAEIAVTSRIHEPLPVDTERVMRTLKEECLWLKERCCPFEQEYHTSHGTQFTIA